jgi:pheromone shutdown protein TraB
MLVVFLVLRRARFDHLEATGGQVFLDWILEIGIICVVATLVATSLVASSVPWLVVAPIHD